MRFFSLLFSKKRSANQANQIFFRSQIQFGYLRGRTNTSYPSIKYYNSIRGNIINRNLFINNNTNKFIVIKGNTINKTTFLNYLTLLKRYITSRQAEVACMYAVQYIVIAEMKNPKGLLEKICQMLYSNGIVSYIAFLDWRENWSKSPVLEVRGKAEAHITLANFFIKLFWESIKPSPNFKSIVKELNSFDLEHFVSMSKLPPEIGKRIKLEEEREKALLKKSKDEQKLNPNQHLPIKTL